MDIQSLSICVPTEKCLNNCKFCCSDGHKNIKFCENKSYKDFFKRLQFARDNGCNVAILTGECEPLQQTSWLMHYFHSLNQGLGSPFKWIEIQTTGVGMNYSILQQIGVTTVSLSLVNPFDDKNNSNVQVTPAKLRFNVEQRCKEIIKEGFNLRISLNMTDALDGITTESILTRCKELGAYAVTFREMYSGQGVKGEWVARHKLNIDNHLKYIVQNGKQLEVLPDGSIKYSINGLSVVVDVDCMSKKTNNVVRYLILRPNGKLYTKWDDEASLLF